MANDIYGTSALQLNLDYELDTATPNRFDFVEGQRQNRSHTQKFELAPTLFHCGAVLFSALVVCAVLRIGMISSAFGYMSENHDIRKSLEVQRIEGAALQTRESTLGRDDLVYQRAVDSLGMVSPEEYEFIELGNQASMTSAADIVAG